MEIFWRYGDVINFVIVMMIKNEMVFFCCKVEKVFLDFGRYVVVRWLGREYNFIR